MRRVCVLTAFLLCAWFLRAETVVQSARQLPVVGQADVVVVGGGSSAVAAAVAAKNAGADVLLLSPRIGLGEDLTGTRELYPDYVDEMLTHPIARVLFPFSSAFNYTADVEPNGAHPDPGNTVLKDGIAASATTGSVEYDSDVTLTLSFSGTGTVERIDLYYYKRVSGDNIFDTEVTSFETSLDGSAWEPVVIATDAAKVQSVGSDELWVCRITPSSGTRLSAARLSLAVPARAVRQLLDEIEIKTSEEDPFAVVGASTTPLAVKKQLETVLDDAGVRFLSAVLVTDIVRDSNNVPAGVVISDRSGRQVVCAKTIIDATENAVPAFRAGALKRPFVPGSYTFSRIVMADAKDAPSAEGLDVDQLPGRTYGVSIAGVNAPAGMQSVVTGRVFRCTFTHTLTTGGMEELLEVEQVARDLTWVKTCIDHADRLVWLPPDAVVGVQQDTAETWTTADALDIDAFRPQGVPFVYVLGLRADIARSVAACLLNPARAMAVADRVGAAAAADALARPALALEGLSVPATTTAGAGASDISERLSGFASKDPLGTLPEGASELPVLDTCDVLVVGAGTGGAPAAISAARAGADTVVVDILYKMGGVQTDGRIGSYYYGNMRGFTTADVEPGWKAKGCALYAAKAEWYRSAARTAGARVLFGTLADGVLLEGNTVKGVVVVLPDGTRGVIRAHTVVDSTGNSEIVQAAGASVYFLDHAELAVQGAGWARHSLGNSYQNTDIGFVNDMDPTDLTFFSRRVHASLSASTWDAGQNPASRERHRVHGVVTVSPIDILNGRTYPDTIVSPKSNFDSHGFTTHDVFFIRDPGTQTITANLPFRALLPETLDGVLVTGLGISAHRDAMPILRMQADVQNQGYAAGYAAALAAQENVAVRAIDITVLQNHLVAKGILTSGQVGNADSFPLAAQTIAAAVENLTNNYAALPVVLADPETARPLLEDALASATVPSNRLIYATTLGLLGDSDAAAVLASALNEASVWDTGWNYRGMGQYGRSVSTLDGYVIAAGRTARREALLAILDKASLLVKTSYFSHHRAVSLALEQLRGAAAVSRLSNLLELVKGYSLASNAAPPVISGYSDAAADTERNNCLKELTIARALYRVGDDASDSGAAVLSAYAADPRGLYSAYARLVLAEGNAFANVDGVWTSDAGYAYWDDAFNWREGAIASVSAALTNTVSVPQTIDLEGASISMDALAFAGQPRVVTNGTVSFAGDAPVVSVAPGASATFQSSVVCASPLTVTGGGSITFGGSLSLAGLLANSGTLVFAPPDASFAQSVGTLTGSRSGSPVTLAVSTGLSLGGLHGSVVKTGGGTLALVCPETSAAPVWSGRVRVAEGAFALYGSQNIASATVPCPSFESVPLLPVSPVASMDKRGSLATGCAGWTFVNNSRFAGYQRNGSYFSANAATVTTNGVQTAMIGKDGSMSCTITVSSAGAYVLRFQSNSRYYSGTGYPNEVLYIRVDGVQAARVVVGNSVWIDQSVELGTLAAGPHTLAFIGSAELASDLCALIDDVRVESSGAFGPVASFVGRDTSLSVADGAAVELNYSGELTLCSLSFGGTVYTSGTFSAATHPGVFSGTGIIVVKPSPMVIMIR